MHVLIENKWIVLACLEVLAWCATFFMLYARYSLNSAFWFRIGAILFAVTGVIPQVVMGIINFFFTRELDFFTLVIVMLIVYGFTIGKKHVRALDKWAHGKFSRTREEKINRAK